MSSSLIRNRKIIEFSNIAVGILIEALAEKGKNIRLKARGLSMFPAIRDGDIIIVAPLIDYQPETGDIVVCINTADQKIVIHRIILKSKDVFKIKGDFCFQSDGVFSLATIKGYVLQIENDLKFSQFSIKNGYKQLIAFLSRINLLALTIRLANKIQAMKKTARLLL